MNRNILQGELEYKMSEMTYEELAATEGGSLIDATPPFGSHGLVSGRFGFLSHVEFSSSAFSLSLLFEVFRCCLNHIFAEFSSGRNNPLYNQK